jgi:TorA maturation chaperone TorD
MKTKTPHLHEIARAKSYKILAECFHMPEIPVLQQINGLRSHIEIVCPDAGDAVGRMGVIHLNDETMNYLMVDHARLFLGPFALLAPPFGSIYMDNERLVMGKSTFDVLAHYLEAGLEMASDFRSTPDHIEVELEFMYYLVFKEVEARIDSDCNRLRHFRRNQKSFLENHLGLWVPQFTRSIEEHAQTEFYRSLAETTRHFVECELRNITGDGS